METYQTVMIIGLMAIIWLLIMVNVYQSRLNKVTDERLKQLEDEGFYRGPPIGTNWKNGMDDHARWAMTQHEERCRATTLPSPDESTTYSCPECPVRPLIRPNE